MENKHAPMTHKQILEAMSGLLLGMLVSILSSTVVSTSLPVIIADLGGTQAAYTWVVTATLLATTVSTPIWGKFADLFNRKLLLQLSLIVFVAGSALGGIASSSGELIAFRVLQGLGAGGLTALSQVIIADMISPRERGRYMGLLGGVMATGTVGGPLLGGLITDSFGWRWNFFVGVPLAIVAIIVLQKTLHLPTRERIKAKIDFLGAGLLTGGVSLLLIWVTLGGEQFAWGSTASIMMLTGSLLLIALTVFVELKTPEPILPIRILKNRTVMMAVIASISIGVAMFGTSVFLSQYLQLARGKTPTESGLLTIPMVGGVLIASILAGQWISRRGTYKAIMVSGTVVLSVGLALMGTIRSDTNWILLGTYMFILGSGVGMVMQNLVLVVQNVLEGKNLGAGTASVAFFRSLGGTIGVSALGTLLSHRITSLITEGMSKLGIDSSGGGTIPNLSELPEPVRQIVESAYGHAVGDVFLAALPLAIIAIIAVSLLPNNPLSRKSAIEQMQEQETLKEINV